MSAIGSILCSGSGFGNASGNFALRFIQHALSFSDLVVVLVGRNMRRLPTVNRVRNGRLVAEYLVPDAASRFVDMATKRSRQVRTVVQVWKPGKPRDPVKFVENVSGIAFLPKGRLHEANVFVRRLSHKSGQEATFRSSRGFSRRQHTLKTQVGSHPNDFLIKTSDVAAFKRLLKRRLPAIRSYVSTISPGNNPALTTPELKTLLACPSKMERPWPTRPLKI